jgi:hypothetical protein
VERSAGGAIVLEGVEGGPAVCVERHNLAIVSSEWSPMDIASRRTGATMLTSVRRRLHMGAAIFIAIFVAIVAGFLPIILSGNGETKDGLNHGSY